jgi:hypothetical protein
MESISLFLKKTKLTGILLLMLGLATGIVAQIVLGLSLAPSSVYWPANDWLNNIWNNASPIPGLFLYAVAAILFLFGLHHTQESLPPFVIHTENPARKPKFGLWITSFGLAAINVLHAPYADYNDRQGYVYIGLWVLSIILFVLSAVLDTGWRLPSTQKFVEWLKKNRAELLLIGAITIVAFCIRFIDVEIHPYSFMNDEGEFGNNAACLLTGECRNIFYVGWAGQPMLNFLPAAINIGLLGRTALAVRLSSVMIGVLAVLAVYLCAREIFNKRVAWVAALLLAALPVHVHFSRLGVANIVDSLTSTLILWLLFRGAKRGSTLSFVAAGIVAGLCMYTYIGSILAPVIGAGALIYIALRMPGFLRANIKNILFLILAITIVILPLLGHYYTHSDSFLARYKGEGIFENGSIQDKIKTTGKNTAQILLDQFAKSSLVYIVTPAPSNFYSSPKPYLIPLVAILFMFGLALTLSRIKDARFMVIIAWLLTPIILGSTLTGGPPSTQRMMMSMPALMMISAVGMITVVESIQQFGQKVLRFAPVILLSLVLYTGYTNIAFYFYEYRNGNFFGNPTNEFTYEASKAIAPLHDQSRLYMIQTPSIPYLSFPSFKFFAPDVEKLDFNLVTRETLSKLSNDKDALFMATPDRILDLNFVRQQIPAGTWNEVKRRYDPTQLLYYSYKISKEQLKGFKP